VLPRFYAPDASEGRTIALPEDEAQHLSRVLRLKRGSGVIVFDGRGREFEAVVERAGRAEALVAVGRRRDAAAREPGIAVTLAQAVLKGDRMDGVVRDAVMIGAAAIQPMVTSRSEVTLAAVERGRRRDRWHRVAVASAKQCGRAVVPPVLDAATFGEIVAPQTIGPAVMFVEPGASAGAVPLGALALATPSEVAVFIGPEGGWTPEEIEAGSRVAHLVTLGSRTLRADAMAPVALAALFTLWKEY
jgi:16S rRNA (uracil1498-N3)-methyltransferase